MRAEYPDQLDYGGRAQTDFTANQTWKLSFLIPPFTSIWFLALRSDNN